MAIDPNLLVVVPINQIETVLGLPNDGWVLFYDGGNSMKKMSIDNFNNLTKSAKPLAPTDPTPTEEGLFDPTIAGTYSNAGGLVAQEGYFTLFYFDGTNWTKTEKLLPQTEISENFNPETETEAQGGKQIDEYLFTNSKNLANPENFKYSYYISYGDGLEYQNAEFSILKSQVVGGKTYYIKKTGEAQSLAYYDINGDFISGVATYGASFTTPSNAYTVKINVKTEQIATFMLSETNIPFVPYFKEFKFENKDYVNNLYDIGKVVYYDSYVSYGDGQIYPNPFHYVAKIFIKPNKKYTVINRAEASMSAIFRADGTLIQGYEKLPKTINTPTGSNYILITLNGLEDYHFFGFYEDEVEGVQNSDNTILSNNIKVLNTYYSVDKYSGDFKDVGMAISSLNDGATIVLHDMFEESLNMLSRKLNLIGINKFTCGIITNDGDYNAPPVNMSAGSTLKNLTIFADNKNPTGSTPTYAIHHDWDGVQGESIIDDCILISKFNASIGIGTHNNQQVTIRNSKLYNLNPNQSANDFGGLYFHNKKGSGATKQMLTVENSVIENLDGAALIIHDANHRTDGAFDDARDTLVRLTHNIFYSQKYGVGAGVIGGDVPFDVNSRWGFIKLHPVNYGNNISELNK